MRLTAILNEENHIYTFTNVETGETFTNDLSITQALRDLGVSPDYSNVDVEMLRKASERGTYLHALAESALKENIAKQNGAMDYIDSNKNEEYDGAYYKNMKQCLYDFELNRNDFKASEQIVMFYTPNGKLVAGSIDLITQQWDNEEYKLSDLKFTYDYHEAAVTTQLNLYLFAINYMIMNNIIVNDLDLSKMQNGKTINLSCLHINKQEAREYHLNHFSGTKMLDLISCIDAGVPYLETQIELVNDNDLQMLKEYEKQIEFYNKALAEIEEQADRIREIVKNGMEENGLKTYQIGSVKYTLVAASTREKFDSKKAKKLLTPEQIKECTSTSEVKSYLRTDYLDKE